MTRYAKLIEGNLYFAPKNKDDICNYNLDIEKMTEDGYKEFVEAEKLNGYSYDITYLEDDNQIIEVAQVIKTPEEEQHDQFLREFFNTSLGYVRRKVNMQNGDVKDFLCDIVPRLQAGVKIITYNVDGTQNKDVVVTQEFINECDQQLLKDFYGEGE
jgi:hypothetical protein